MEIEKDMKEAAIFNTIESQKLLESIINQEKEISAEKGSIVNLGQLKGETPPEHWTGNISVQKRIENGDITQAEINKHHSQLGGYFTEVDYGSPKRCGDGRIKLGFNFEEIINQKYGVQDFGGTVGDAIGTRLSKGYEAGSSLVSDVKETIMNFDSKFAAGDHTDDHAEGEKTGCGAIDGQQRKNIILTDNEKFVTVKTVLSYLCDKAGLELKDNFFERLSQNSNSLKQHAYEYFKDVHLVLDDIKKQSPNGVETLSGVHNETSLTLNFVPGTTFNRDLYSYETESKIQNFNIDVWAILKEHGENTPFVLADDIATALDLTDGSIEVFARIPNDEPEATN